MHSLSRMSACQMEAGLSLGIDLPFYGRVGKLNLVRHQVPFEECWYPIIRSRRVYFNFCLEGHWPSAPKNIPVRRVQRLPTQR